MIIIFNIQTFIIKKSVQNYCNFSNLSLSFMLPGDIRGAVMGVIARVDDRVVDAIARRKLG